MGWESRHSGLFYYKSQRINGQPRKLYVGRGESAIAQARKDDEARQQRQAERDALLAEQGRPAIADIAMSELHAIAGMLARTTLLLGGFHERKGEWRKRRSRGRAER